MKLSSVLRLLVEMSQNKQGKLDYSGLREKDHDESERTKIADK